MKKVQTVAIYIVVGCIFLLATINEFTYPPLLDLRPVISDVVGINLRNSSLANWAIYMALLLVGALIVAIVAGAISGIINLFKTSTHGGK